MQTALIALGMAAATVGVFVAQTGAPTQMVSGDGWVNAGLGGIAIALISLVGWLLKLWVHERKENNKLQSENTERLVHVIDKSNEVIGGNTEAIRAVCKQSDAAATKIDDIRDRLLRRPCMVDDKQ